MKKIIISLLALVLMLGLVVGVNAANGDELNVPQHTWAPGHASNPTSTVLMKWGLAAGTYDGSAVTICDSTWTSINGETGYIDYSCHAHGQFFCIWENNDQTGNIAPTATEFSATGGYLAGSAGGRLLEGHVSCPLPPVCGNGIVEGGTPMFPAEECDDGNVIDGDGCSSTCQIEGKIASLQHLWDVEHGSNPYPTLYMKWGCNAFPDVANKCDQYGDTRPVTFCGTPWDSVNGLAVNLIPETPGSERFLIHDLTGGNTNATEVVGGYTNQGFIMEGDVLCPGEVQTKSEILQDSGIPGKGLENAPGLQKPFNPNSEAAEHAGKKK